MHFISDEETMSGAPEDATVPNRHPLTAELKYAPVTVTVTAPMTLLEDGKMSKTTGGSRNSNIIPLILKSAPLLLTSTDCSP
jgi:hypothetical protein